MEASPLGVSLAGLHVLEDFICAFDKDAILFVIYGDHFTYMSTVDAANYFDHIARFDFHGFAFANGGGIKKQEWG